MSISFYCKQNVITVYVCSNFIRGCTIGECEVSLTTAIVTKADNSITSLLSSCIGFVMEALVAEDILLACNLLSQMVDYLFILL